MALLVPHRLSMTTTTRSTGPVVKLAGQAEDHLSRLRSHQQGPLYRKEGPGHFGRHVVSDRDLGDPKRRDP